MHCISHPAYHAMFCIMLLAHCTMVDHGSLCLLFLLWVEPGDEYVIEEPAEYAYEDQAFVNSENFVGKMTIPSKSLLSLLASCSLFCYATIPTTCYIMPPILPWQAFNPPFLANRCLAMLPLCSAPLIALLVADEDEVCSLLGHDYCSDIIIISCYFNASIYLVKGGRLGLMPGVLFHSCCPSFRHTGVMFLYFAFLTRLGYNGNPLTVLLE